MKNIWLLTKTNMKRNSLAILFSILIAAMLCLILYAMGNLVIDMTVSKIQIGIMDRDNSKLSEDFKEYLSNQLNYELIENNDYDTLSSELIEKNISVIIEIPEDFYEQYSLGNKKEIIVTALDDFENVAFIEVYVNQYMSSIHMLSISAEGNPDIFDQLLTEYNKEEIAIIQVAAQEIDKAAVGGRSGFINSIGFFLMLIFGICIMLSFAVLEDRLSGVFNRIQVTPVKPVQYILGSVIFGMIICMITVVVYCGFIYFKKIQIGVPIGTLILMMSLFSLFTISFSLAVPLAVKSKNAIISIIIGFSTIGNILGGAYFPIDMSPKNLQNLARVFPQFWFMDTFRKLQIDITANIYPNIIILSLFVILTILIGAVLFSQNYKSS